MMYQILAWHGWCKCVRQQQRRKCLSLTAHHNVDDTILLFFCSLSVVKVKESTSFVSVRAPDRKQNATHFQYFNKRQAKKRLKASTFASANMSHIALPISRQSYLFDVMFALPWKWKS